MLIIIFAEKLTEYLLCNDDDENKFPIETTIKMLISGGDTPPKRPVLNSRNFHTNYRRILENRKGILSSSPTFFRN
jgi:hypothetical protein